MPAYIFIWSDETIEHLEEHGVSPDEFERVVQDPDSNGLRNFQVEYARAKRGAQETSQPT